MGRGRTGFVWFSGGADDGVFYIDVRQTGSARLVSQYSVASGMLEYLETIWLHYMILIYSQYMKYFAYIPQGRETANL